MAEIEIERRPRRNTWTWVALLLVLIGVAVGAWLIFGGGAVENGAPPATETTAPAPMVEPEVPLERGPATESAEERGTVQRPAEPTGGPGAGADTEPTGSGAGGGI